MIFSRFKAAWAIAQAITPQLEGAKKIHEKFKEISHCLNWFHGKKQLALNSRCANGR
jgi:hypothetical protein